MRRVIVHLDADAFFASVEQAADSRLRGKPVAVGGEKRGIIASASYEARKMGIYTPMPTARARKLCPKLILLPGDFEKYEKFSRWMFSYAYDFTPDVEIASIDEGYFDLSGVRKPPVEVAQTIRRAIGQSLKISVSEGIGSSKLVSQIAAKLRKPAAFECVPSGQEIPFLHPLPNRWLPGVGGKTADRLNSAGLALIGQVAITSLDLLNLLLGKRAEGIRRYANGLDERPIIPVSDPAKSYSQQETFNADTTDEEYCEAVLRRMADNLMAKVREDGKTIRTVMVKVRYNDMAEDQCGESLVEPTDLETDIYGRIGVLFRAAWKRRVSLRLVSLKLSNVYDGRFRAELGLERSAQQQEARRRLAEAVDQLRHTHGRGILLRGHDFRLREPVKTDAPVPGKDRIVIRIHTAPVVPKTYVPLCVRSHFSFLNSTLSIPAIIAWAKRHQVPAIALADQGNLHGAVEFAVLAKQAGIKPIIGATVNVDSSPVCLYVQNSTGYRNLCGLLSSKTTAPSPNGDDVPVDVGRVSVTRSQLDARTEGLIGVSGDLRLADLFPRRFYAGESSLNERATGSHPAVACLPVHYEQPEDRWKYDVVQSIRTRTLLKQAHPAKLATGEFHFLSPAEMTARFKDHPDRLSHTVEIADRCDFQFTLGQPQFPAFPTPDGSSPHDFLRRLVIEGLQGRYGNRAEKMRPQIEEELGIISEVGYEEYFLVVWDILQMCQAQGIEWITRGSAADSLVCYCLGISDVCPVRFDLYFRRFLNKERMALKKLPDIDVDFPHDRKDDVVDLIFQKYGPEHTAVVGGFSTFQARSAVADVAKVLGVSEYQIRRFTEHFPWRSAGNIEETLKQSQECRDLPIHEEPYRSALAMAQFLDGFPRYPKMHPCGVVLSRQPMLELTPTFRSSKGYPTTHFNMDAVEAIGLVKMDILAQGGLAVMRDTKRSLAARGMVIDLKSLEPWDDPQVWEMIASGGARAVHHIESPAMIGLCRQCNVREIDGLIAIVSVIRPGAANESKKVRFTRRYQGLEPTTYPDPSLEACLQSTYGLVVYEEHILQICEAFAGLPAGRADVLRRALGKSKQEVIEKIGGEFLAAAKARGRGAEKIVEVWELVKSFAGYAFCKAHSTAYGKEAYEAAWLKRYHPAEFMAGVLTNGKGFYHPLVYVLECHRLGISMLPPWVNQPGPQFTVENGSIRVPLTRVKGLTEKTQGVIGREFARGLFASLADFYRRVAPSPDEMESLIRVGSFDGFGQPRTAQFWNYQHLHQAFGHTAEPGQGWLLPAPGLEKLPQVPLREPTRRERLEWESDLLGFTASGHPLELYDDIAWETYCPVARLEQHIGERVVTCGLVIEQRLHHQVTGEMMKFLTLADRTGIVETELFASTYRSYGLATVRYPVLEVEATVEPFENGRGFSLRVLRAGRPRQQPDAPSSKVGLPLMKESC